MNEPRASEPKKRDVVEYTFSFRGGSIQVVSLDGCTLENWTDDEAVFKLKDRTLVVQRANVDWYERRVYQVPVKEPAGPPQAQPALFV